MSGEPAATVVVVTKNRREELREMLPSVLAQTAAIEVLVVDDGSEDGTLEMVHEHFPQVRTDRSEQSMGLIEQRTRAAALARGPIVFSIDDDARFASDQTVEQTLADFDHPRIGAVAIPFLDIRTSTQLRQVAPDDSHRWITSSYIGTAHAVRRDVFLGVGGYRSGLGQMAEEPDLCLRMLAMGYVTRLGRADRIEHYESPKRDLARITELGRRNDILHGWFNVPMPYLLGRWLKVTLHSALMAVQWRRPGPVARGLWSGYRESLRRRRERAPVPAGVYRVDHDIRKRGPLRLEDVDGRLPQPRFE